MKYWLLAAGAALLLAACDATVPMAGPAQDTAGKTFSAPSADRAALYVFAPGRSGTVFTMSLDQWGLGTLGRAKWLRVDVRPGSYDLRCVGASISPVPDSFPLTLKAGDTTFVRADFQFSDPACRLTAVTAAAAKPAIVAGHRIREVGGASD
jgi:hypothetical protein